ncbi:MAG: Ldh family oxidoreductase [Anaerolineales bacterium]|nr:Ldh family oxidoreductase [Anaerolineales bacterium]
MPNLTLPLADARRLGRELFTAAGAPPDEAALVTEELIEASLMGLDSHGLLRFGEYANWAREGRVKPGAPAAIVHETPTTAIVECGLNFGQVSAAFMVNLARHKAAAAGMACVVSRNCGHVGRLGAWPQKLAEQGFLGLAFANSTRHGHWVTPFGGREGRLATNPLAYAVPTSGQPLVMDMSTAMIAEGKIRMLMHQGKPIPPGAVIDADGRPTTDPQAFYGPPHGWILPFGGDLGYKGFGLSLLVEIMGGLLGGFASTDHGRHINGFCLLALDPDKFCGRARFQELVDDLAAYVVGAPPLAEGGQVVLPGQLDFRTRARRLAEGLPLPETTWRQIEQAAAALNLDLGWARVGFAHRLS